MHLAGSLTVTLPPPALPPHIMSLAAAYASNTSDLQAAAAAAAAASEGAAKASASAASSTTATALTIGADGIAHVGGPAGEAWLLDRCSKAGAAPMQSWGITPTTKLGFAPTVHADAFELSDRTSFLGFTSKLVLRAASPDDCVDWVVALNHVIDIVAHAHAMGEQ